MAKKKVSQKGKTNVSLQIEKSWALLLTKLGIVFLAFISVGAVVAVPTYITFREITNHAQHAEEDKTQLLEENQSGIESEDLLSY
jgi:hypothetical protein